MILNMWKNRKSAFKKRSAASAPARQVTGIQWPVTNETTKERGSSITNKAIWSAAMGAVDKEVRHDCINDYDFASKDLIQNLILWTYRYARICASARRNKGNSTRRRIGDMGMRST